MNSNRHQDMCKVIKRTKSLSTLFAILLVHTASPASAGEISPGLSERLQYLDHNEHLSVIVRMADQADLKAATQDIIGRNKALRSKKVIKALKATAITQEALIAFLEKETFSGKVVRYTSFWIFNGLSVRATSEVIKKTQASKSSTCGIAKSLTLQSGRPNEILMLKS